jgi:hypothetical protein
MAFAFCDCFPSLRTLPLPFAFTGFSLFGGGVAEEAAVAFVA